MGGILEHHGHRFDRVAALVVGNVVAVFGGEAVLVEALEDTVKVAAGLL